MEPLKFPPFFPILLSGLVIGGIGWVGLALIILGTDPELGFRWLFFFFTLLAMSGSSLPVVAFLNRRFASQPPAGEGVLLRQAVWFGLYGSLMAWLQLGRILNFVFALFIAIGLILIESFLRMGERARWQPDKEPLNE